MYRIIKRKKKNNIINEYSYFNTCVFNIITKYLEKKKKTTTTK